MGVASELLLVAFLSVIIGRAFAGSVSCSNRSCRLMESCSNNSDCAAGLFCFTCRYPRPNSGSRCVRSTVTNPFRLVNNSMPYNKYAFLATHNSFAIKGEPSSRPVPRVTFTNQEDSITEQLNNGVRALLLDTYDYKGDVWLCHSFKGKCHAYTAFGRAIDTFREIEAFMSKNPSEIVTIILEDYVEAPKGLTKLFGKSGLKKYWFPVSRMPTNGRDWPSVKDMVAKNQRLVVFTSMESKQKDEGIAYQWNYMVENQFGNGGMKAGSCPKRNESAPMDDRTKSLVFVNHFKTVPMKLTACEHNSEELIQMLQTCHVAAGNRWANFVAVDYYKRSAGGGVFQAVDTLNGELLCGCNDVHACKVGSSRICRKAHTTLPYNAND